jgi:hypothetical protein
MLSYKESSVIHDLTRPAHSQSLYCLSYPVHVLQSNPDLLNYTGAETTNSLTDIKSRIIVYTILNNGKKKKFRFGFRTTSTCDNSSFTGIRIKWFDSAITTMTICTSSIIDRAAPSLYMHWKQRDSYIFKCNLPVCSGNCMRPGVMLYYFLYRHIGSELSF